MTINLTILFVAIGIAILSTFAQMLLKKAGNETGAWLVGLVEILIGFGIVLKMFKGAIDMIFEMFFLF